MTCLDHALDLRAAGRLPDALAALTGAAEHTPYLSAIRGEIEFALGRFQDAALSYSTVALSAPDNAGAHYNLAVCFQRTGRWEAAADAFARVLQLDSWHAQARLGAGVCLLRLGRVEEALGNFTHGCLSGIPAALFGKAVASQVLGRFDEATPVYEELLASDFNPEEVLSNLIAMGIEAEDLESVRGHSLRLLKLRPRSLAALQGLATVAFENSEAQSAGSYCDRILELAPDCLEAWHNFRIAMDRLTVPSFRPAVTVLLGRKL